MVQLHRTARRLPISNNRQENIEAFSLSIGPAARKRWSPSYWPVRGCRNRVIGFKQAKDWLRFGGCSLQIPSSASRLIIYRP